MIAAKATIAINFDLFTLQVYTIHDILAKVREKILDKVTKNGCISSLPESISFSASISALVSLPISSLPDSGISLSRLSLLADRSILAIDKFSCHVSNKKIMGLWLDM